MGRENTDRSLRIAFPVESLSKSWGDAHVSPVPNAPHHMQHADSDLMRDAANTTSDAHVDVYTLYRRIMGRDASGKLSVETLQNDENGTLYRLDDGRHILRVYQPRIGPARLVKALSTFVPAANVAWTALREAGYEFRVRDHEARVKGCLVRVDGNTVQVIGAHAQLLLRVILAALRRKQTSEAWVGGHQQFSTSYLTAKPW